MAGGRNGAKEVEASVKRLFTYAAWADKYDGAAKGAPFRGVALAMNEPVGVIGAFLPDDSWTLRRHSIPSAAAFQRWVYRNMVVEPVLMGLLTNLFSEIYNHAEYALAQRAFANQVSALPGMTPETGKRVLTYIDAHVEGDTEVNHFLVVLDAIERYRAATGEALDVAVAEAHFRSYLRRLGAIMSELQRICLTPLPELAPLGSAVAAPQI